MRSQLHGSLARPMALGIASSIAPGIAVLALSGSLRADIIVGPEGSGAQTDSINDAVFNAGEGETIFVLPGTYDNLQLKRKSVRILGAGPDQVTFAYTGDALFSESSRIFDLTETQEVFISGVTFDTLVSTSFNGSADVFDNEGRVTFHDCVFRTDFGSTVATLQVSACSEVILDQCQVFGFSPAELPMAIAASGADALNVSSSKLWLNACEIHGGDAPQSASFFANGGAGLRLSECVVALHGCEVTGGQGFNSSPGESTAGDGIRASQSELVLSGPAGSRVLGGDGFTDDEFVVTAGGSALVFEDALCSLTQSEAVELIGGLDSDGVPAEAAELAGAPVTLELFGRPGLQPSVPAAAPGQSFELLLDGDALAAQAVALSLGTVPTYTLATAFGEAVLDPASTTVLAAIALDADGLGALTLDLPAEPVLSGTIGWFQSLQTGLGGGARVSLPTVFRVGP